MADRGVFGTLPYLYLYRNCPPWISCRFFFPFHFQIFLRDFALVTTTGESLMQIIIRAAVDLHWAGLSCHPPKGARQLTRLAPELSNHWRQNVLLNTCSAMPTNMAEQQQHQNGR
ncbi:hypothetical protein GE21DRAFT_1199793 [Neurospora crassa]|nr:hypothetical protein 13E11.210 [imported] - Neurospora crassa [Neurospora crassa]KHE88249.1 hypothetical protein GE21DRAFT_1199793 [Neurospora crassa]